MAENLHAPQPLCTAGPPVNEADATLLLLHGRGASAESMIALYQELLLPNIAAIAPQAANHTWYPHSFLAPMEMNQPWLGWALERIEQIVDSLLARQLPAKNLVVLGFSQGACLACEFAARHPRTYGGLIALTGGLIGPPDTPRIYPGSLTGLPVLLTSGDPDPHVPFARVQETRDVLTRMGATVDMRRYPGRPHTVMQEELSLAQRLIASVAHAH